MATEPFAAAGFPLDRLPHSPLGKLLGFRYPVISADRVVVECDVTEGLMQPFGMVHGGTYCALVEEAGSIGGMMAMAARRADRGTDRADGWIVGVHNATDFLRPVSAGVLRAEATPVHLGRSQQLWEVRITGSDGKLVARGQLRLHHVTGAAGPTVPAGPA